MIIKFFFKTPVIMYPHIGKTQKQLDEEKYQAALKIYHQRGKQWKALFGNLTIDEAIDLMERIKTLQDTKRKLLKH